MDGAVVDFALRAQQAPSIQSQQSPANAKAQANFDTLLAKRIRQPGNFLIAALPADVVCQE